jgi:two-component system sensor histidine kinase KdpD
VNGDRGELRIYFGAAPGVGKTFAMLGEAHRRVERGTDVVVGLVETHGRDRTAELVDGLEVLARKRLTYRGVEFGELDVDAVLARGPEVVLVDELAHTNVEGSRNTKRWQDIERLRDAGIDVLSTVNVQHLESLNDVVQRITGARQQETVPDDVVRKADQVELVDITPEALRRRLAHGNVYAADRVDAALGNYFRQGNLIALRELALLWVADQVDVALRRYRTEQDITDTWETRERVVVAITAGEESSTLLRRARRIANRAGGELVVVHVFRGDGLAVPSPSTIARYRKLAEDLGGSFHTVVGEDVPTAMLDFARGVNATQLVVGTSRRGRFARLFDEGIGAEVIRGSGPIDVHMVTHEAAAGHLHARIGRSPLTVLRRVLGWLMSLLAPGIVTLGGVVLADEWNLSTNVAGFVLATVVVALIGGLGPALLSALLGGLLLNFFFAPPVHTFTIATAGNLVTLITMLVVAVLVALVVDGAARRAAQAKRARTEAALLASYARVLMGPRPLERLLAKIAENFGQSSVALLERTAGEWNLVASVGENPCTQPDSGDVSVPVTEDVQLALRGRSLAAADRRALEAAAGQALLALRQQRMTTEAEQAHRMMQTSQLRTALLSAVGHDLRTPLTSIKAAVDSLRDEELQLSTVDTAELLATVAESGDRLRAVVDNLLDSSRLAAGAITVASKPVGYDEVVAKALSGVDGRALVEVDVSDRLPQVLADPGLLERVVVNVIDNALRHGGNPAAAGSGGPAVWLRASAYGGAVELRIVDHGRGIPKNSEGLLFAPFQRLGDRDATPGIGLGLSVAKGFTEAMGGTIRAEDTPGGGLTVVISLGAEPGVAMITDDVCSPAEES